MTRCCRAIRSNLSTKGNLKRLFKKRFNFVFLILEEFSAVLDEWEGRLCVALCVCRRGAWHGSGLDGRSALKKMFRLRHHASVVGEMGLQEWMARPRAEEGELWNQRKNGGVSVEGE